MIKLTDNEFEELINYIKINYGINLTEKRPLIIGRLSNMILSKGFTNFSEYMSMVLNDPSGIEISNIINKLTTNHTFFMREKDHFYYFRDSILPYLKENTKDKDLRIWSAGCSSGEEPYTLAMILSDFFEDNKLGWNNQILATDISSKVLESAEKGIYTAEAIRNLPAYWLIKYFKQIDSENYEISQRIKNEVIFRKFNLMKSVYPFKKKFHVIFCRNVMIYFDLKTKIELINKFYDMTESGGYLFIGHSESINKENTKYKYVMSGIYRKG